MNNIQHKIDEELKGLTLPSDFADNIIHTKENALKPVYKRIAAAAALILATIILGTSTIAGHFQHRTILVNQKQTPKLDKMIVYPYAIEGDKMNRTVFRQYDDYESVKKMIPFSLLDSKYATDDEMIRVTYSSDPYNTGCQFINIDGFILGDATVSDISPTRDQYSCSAGKDFDSPVNLDIIILSDSQKAAKNLPARQFEGVFEFIEQYTSNQGYKVNIIGYKENNKGCWAIFVADGIEYELSGDVTLEKMKEIVDSMEY